MPLTRSALPVLLLQLAPQVYQREPIQVSICDLLQNLPSYNMKLVRVSGDLETNPGSFLRAYGCPAQLKIKDCRFENHLAFSWPTDYAVQLNMERLGYEPSRTLFPLDEAGRKKVVDALSKEAQPLRVQVVVEGLIVTRLPLEDLVYPKQPIYPRGFGHLGAAPAYIVVKKVIEVFTSSSPASATKPASPPPK